MRKNDEYYFKEGCYIQEWHNSDQDKDLSIAHVRVAANQTTKLHCLSNTVERYTILEGSALVTVGDTLSEVAPNDVVVIPAGVAQKIQNLENSDLRFLAICTPRFEEKNYTGLE